MVVEPRIWSDASRDYEINELSCGGVELRSLEPYRIIIIVEVAVQFGPLISKGSQGFPKP
jgi:hypothetical protein